MSGKSPLDHNEETTDDKVVDRFAEIERTHGEDGSNPSAQQAHRRPKAESGKRNEEFVRIDKGKEA